MKIVSSEALALEQKYCSHCGVKKLHEKFRDEEGQIYYICLKCGEKSLDTMGKQLINSMKKWGEK